METTDPAAQVTAWQLTLEDCPYSTAELALGRWFKERRWPPDPSELRQMILSMLDETPEPADAWLLVTSHIKRNGLIGGKPFDGPSIVEDTVKAIGGWFMLRMSTDPGQDREQFLKAYDTYARRSLSSINLAELVANRAAALTEGEDQ